MNLAVIPNLRLAPALRAAWLAVALLANAAMALGPNPALAVEPVQRIVSPGGIEALLIESHDVELISMRISFAG